MRGGALAASLVLLLAACRGDAARPSPEPTVLGESQEAQPTATVIAPAVTRTIVPQDAERAVAQCAGALDSGEAGAPAALAAALESCLARRAPVASVIEVPGGQPVLMASIGLRECSNDNFVVWRVGDGWRWQRLTEPRWGEDFRPLRGDGRPYPAGLTLPVRPQRMAMVAGRTFLAAIFGTAGCGSGPELTLVLFDLQGERWRLAWDAAHSAIEPLSHTWIDFLDEGIETVRVRGDSWTLPDAKSRTFQESNPGPHRGFEQKWTLRGDAYALVEERVEPSAYSTLVEFVYRLSTGDEAGAMALAVDPMLVARAKELGLVQQPPGQSWLTNGDAIIACCGPIEILEGPPQKVVVSFVEGADGGWLVAAIGPLP